MWLQKVGGENLLKREGVGCKCGERYFISHMRRLVECVSSCGGDGDGSPHDYL